MVIGESQIIFSWYGKLREHSCYGRIHPSFSWIQMKINEWLCIDVFEMESVKLELYLAGIEQAGEHS